MSETGLGLSRREPRLVGEVAALRRLSIEERLDKQGVGSREHQTMLSTKKCSQEQGGKVRLTLPDFYSDSTLGVAAISVSPESLGVA